MADTKTTAISDVAKELMEKETATIVSTPEKTEVKIEETTDEAPKDEVKVEVEDKSTTTVAPTPTPAPKVEAPKLTTKSDTISSPKKSVPLSAPIEGNKAKNESTASMYIRDYITRYLTINDGYLNTEAKRRQTIEAFRQICMYAIKHPEDAVLEQVVAFFADKETRKKVLSEEMALQGLQNYNRDEHMKISIFYRLFYDYTNPNRKKGSHPNMEQVRSVFKSDAIVNFVTSKFSK